MTLVKKLGFILLINLFSLCFGLQMDNDLDYSDILPMETLLLIFTFALNKWNAIIAWNMCRKWRECVRMMPELFETWNFKKYPVALPVLMSDGISIWDNSFFKSMVDIRNQFLSSRMIFHISFHHPNIIKFFGNCNLQWVLIQIKHDCTVWNRYKVAKVILDLDCDIIGDIVIRNSSLHKELRIIPKTGDSITFAGHLLHPNLEYSDDETDEDHPGATFGAGLKITGEDIIKFISFVDNIRKKFYLNHCIINMGTKSLLMYIFGGDGSGDTLFVNSNNNGDYEFHINIVCAKIVEWGFYIKHHDIHSIEYIRFVGGDQRIHLVVQSKDRMTKMSNPNVTFG